MDQHGGIKRKVESDDYSESLFEKKKGPRAPWTSQDMISAMMLVKQGMSITKAAQSLNIPRTTLRDRVTGNMQTKNFYTQAVTLIVGVDQSIDLSSPHLLIACHPLLQPHHINVN